MFLFTEILFVLNDCRSFLIYLHHGGIKGFPLSPGIVRQSGRRLTELVTWKCIAGIAFKLCSCTFMAMLRMRNVNKIFPHSIINIDYTREYIN
jgi:hypothetical protein